MTVEPTLENLLATTRGKPFCIPVDPPSRPYYLRAVEDLEHWADGLERIDPTMLAEDRRQYLDGVDLRDVASVLRRLAESEEARRLIFLGAKSKPGPYARTADRDYLLAFEYCLRQRLSGKRGLAAKNVHATAERWAAWRIKDATVREARTTYGKRCRDAIEFQVTGWAKTTPPTPLDDVLAALFRGVLAARERLPKKD